MKIVHHLIIRSILALALASLAANGHAQLVADGQTNMISGTNVTVSGDLTVGTNGSLTALLLTNSPVNQTFLRVDGSTIIGREPGSFSNLIQVGNVFSFSTTMSTTNLLVGFNGVGNQFILRAASFTNVGMTSIGANAGANSNTVALLSGSAWLAMSDPRVFVGQDGAFNQLTARSGAKVYWGDAGTFPQIEIGYGLASSNNTVTVEGPLTRITNQDFFTSWNVGNAGSGNQLIISNGATVKAAFTTLGKSATSSNNQVLVGTGSVSGGGSATSWVVRTNINVGLEGSGNSLTVSNWAVVLCRELQVGGDSSSGLGTGSSNNLVVVAGPPFGQAGYGLTTTVDGIEGIPGSSIALHVSVGSVGDNNRMVITNGAQVGTGTTDSSGIIGRLGNGNEMVVGGPSTTWSAVTTPFASYDGVVVGYAGSQNRLITTNGGSVVCNSLILGALGSSSNNFLQAGNGSITVSNAEGSAVLDVRRGTLFCRNCFINADRILLTNGAASGLQFNFGTLHTRGLTNDNASAFVVGNATTNKSSLYLEGTNGHFFGGGLTVPTNATGFLNGGVVTSPLGLTIQKGGRVQAGTNDALAAGTPLSLEGGTFALSGFSQAPSLGALSHSADSVIDFGPNGMAQDLTFSNLASHTPGKLLRIINWQGSPANRVGTDRLVILGGVTDVFLADVRFNGYGPGAIQLATGELVPLDYYYLPLSVANTGSNFVLSWITSDARMILQQATNLTLPSPWADVTETTHATGTTNLVELSVDPSVTNRFFRLRLP